MQNCRFLRGFHRIFFTFFDKTSNATALNFFIAPKCFFKNIKS